MKLSALLDGELSEAEGNQLFDAMAQDPDLLSAFEALAAARVPAPQALSGTDADALTASVMAAVDPDDMPASVAGVTLAASLAFDGEPHAPLAFASAAHADAVTGFLATAELGHVGARAVSETADAARALAPLADLVSASVATTERANVLVMADADSALTAAEGTELAGLWARADETSAGMLAGMVHVREALRAATDSAAFTSYARKAGDAAVSAIEAIARNEARTPAYNVEKAVETVGFFARFWQGLAVARVPLALAGGAAALFFALRSPTDTTDVIAPNRALLASNTDALAAELGRELLQDLPRPAELPLLADNGADVEALDANGTTMVFSTQESNITVIWVAGDDDEGEQG